jgi:endonuclease G, mitochondrial
VKFHEDQRASCTTLESYRHSGFDRGHLTPAADMKYSEDSEFDCFSLANMCPQKHSFNAGIWESLEKKVREWCFTHDSLLVISSPVESSLSHTGQLTVPGEFFKIIYSYKRKTAIAFLLGSETPTGDIFNYKLSISEIDKKLDIPFLKGKKIVTDFNFWMN